MPGLKYELNSVMVAIFGANVTELQNYRTGKFYFKANLCGWLQERTLYRSGNQVKILIQKSGIVLSFKL